MDRFFKINKSLLKVIHPLSKYLLYSFWHIDANIFILFSPDKINIKIINFLYTIRKFQKIFYWRFVLKAIQIKKIKWISGPSTKLKFEHALITDFIMLYGNKIILFVPYLFLIVLMLYRMVRVLQYNRDSTF